MLRVVDSPGSMLRHPLLADRTKIHPATGSPGEQQRHRETKETGANRNPHRDGQARHRAIMPDLGKLRNRFIGRLSFFLHPGSRAKRQHLRDEFRTVQSSYQTIYSWRRN
jgi:hypothetical protein